VLNSIACTHTHDLIGHFPGSQFSMYCITVNVWHAQCVSLALLTHFSRSHHWQQLHCSLATTWSAMPL